MSTAHSSLAESGASASDKRDTMLIFKEISMSANPAPAPTSGSIYARPSLIHN